MKFFTKIGKFIKESWKITLEERIQRKRLLLKALFVSKTFKRGFWQC